MKPTAGCRWESKQSNLISKPDPLLPPPGAEGDTVREEKRGPIERLSGLRPASFVMSSCGLWRPTARPGRPWPGYTSHRSSTPPADAPPSAAGAEPSGCTAEHRNINTTQTQPGPWERLARQTGRGSSPGRGQKRGPRAAREIRAARR